jgi:hypothetical protein
MHEGAAGYSIFLRYFHCPRLGSFVNVQNLGKMVHESATHPVFAAQFYAPWYVFIPNLNVRSCTLDFSGTGHCQSADTHL